ncbi:HzsA-related protein [Thermopirellula anaerolimosa]
MRIVTVSGAFRIGRGPSARKSPGQVRFCTLFVGMAITLLASTSAASESATADVPAWEEKTISEEMLTRDWLRQAELRSGTDTRILPVKPEDDARGACDGVKDGKWGFHTQREVQPWWQVDLGRIEQIGHLLIFNRCDGGTASRAAKLCVLISDDGTAWREVYRHDGSPFQGAPDGKPLRVAMNGLAGRFVRLQLADTQYFHLDEVEIYGPGEASAVNLALGKPALQSSVSPWSVQHPMPGTAESEPDYPVDLWVERGEKLAGALLEMNLSPEAEKRVRRELRTIQEAKRSVAVDPAMPREAQRELFFCVCAAIRRMSRANPLLDFDRLVFVKRAPPAFHHMSDQFYGWWCRPNGGLYVMDQWKTDHPRLRCLTASLPSGSAIRPDVSYDGTKILFSYSRYYPGLHEEPNKLDKGNVPEDAFFHVYEVNADGTGLRQLTAGKYDDMDARYLPDGRIVFLSTRRGVSTQVLPTVQSTGSVNGPDCYVRCGGGPERPVAIYTLHVMDADGSNIHPISAFESFEWHPCVDWSGRVLYARWDYVDRHNQPYMGLWATFPDGTGVQAVYGNFTRNPLSIFEARPIPGSHKLVFTASAHHSITGGSLCLLDTRKGLDDEPPLTRLTPEVCFPESEGWPKHYFANPYPLSEEHFLVSWSDGPLADHGQKMEDAGAGIYLFDAFGNLNLIYRDETIGCECPVPLRPRRREISSMGLVDSAPTEREGSLLVADIYEGMPGIPRGAVRELRVVGIPVKTHPTMNYPNLGLTREDPGKFVIGSAPVESDGSAYFRVPAGVSLFLQAVDEHGMALRTMRTAIYVQPGQTASCVGCHEPRTQAPPARPIAAMYRQPSRLRVGPPGSWPLDYEVLVQPVLNHRCVECHQAGKSGEKWDLSAGRSFDVLTHYGSPSLAQTVAAAYQRGRSLPGEGHARMNPLWAVLDQGHFDVQLTGDEREQLALWMDLYGQHRGSFDARQEEELRELLQTWNPLLVQEKP